MTDVAHVAAHIHAAAGQITRFMYAGRSFKWLPSDLTLPQLKVLLLAAAEEGATGGQTARDLGVSLPTVSGIVDRLEEHGLVERRDDPADRRVTRVVATADGQALVQRLYQFRIERLTDLLTTLSPDELSEVAHAFGVLAAAARVCRGGATEPMAMCANLGGIAAVDHQQPQGHVRTRNAEVNADLASFTSAGATQ